MVDDLAARIVAGLTILGALTLTAAAIWMSRK